MYDDFFGLGFDDEGGAVDVFPGVSVEEDIFDGFEAKHSFYAFVEVDYSLVCDEDVCVFPGLFLVYEAADEDDYF